MINKGFFFQGDRARILKPSGSLEIAVPSSNSISGSSDHLCEPPIITPAGGSSTPSGVPGGAATGGRVRFVDSTVRYHMGTGPYATLWTSRSYLERILIAAVAILIFVISILFITLGESQRRNIYLQTSNSHPSGLCLSQECIRWESSQISGILCRGFPMF